MSKIRQYFESRFIDGRLMEFDFSQLEVIVLAYLSQDKQLIYDVTHGVDVHTVMAAKLFDIPESGVTKAQRKIAKSLTFQLQYGAGAFSMAKKCNIKASLAQTFIDEYYKRYPAVKEWQDNNIIAVRASRTVGSTKSPSGYPVGVGQLASITGRVYTFKEKENKYARVGGPMSFSPTEIKNYPVQGLATGDIVPMILGKLYRELKLHHPNLLGNVLMVNTVHDSIVFDVRSGYEQKCYDAVMPVMNNVVHYLKTDFNIDFNVPVTAECEIGTNWMEMSHYEP